MEALLAGAEPAQIAAFLVLLRAKGETADEVSRVSLTSSTFASQLSVCCTTLSMCMSASLPTVRAHELHRQAHMDHVSVDCLLVPFPMQVAGLARAMQAVGVPVLTSHDSVLDIVGTGGDGANTVNISTGACVLAAACGARVAKVGSAACASSCASAVHSQAAVWRQVHSGTVANFASFSRLDDQARPSCSQASPHSSLLGMCAFASPCSMGIGRPPVPVEVQMS